MTESNESEVSEQPAWEQLEAMVGGADAEQLDAFLDQLPAGEAALAVSRLEDDNQTQLLEKLSPTDAADLLEEMPEVEAAEMLENLGVESAAAIVAELPSDEQVDLLNLIRMESSDAILAEMPSAEAAQIREMAEYPADSAGGLMITEYLAYAVTDTVADVVADMRENVDTYRDYELQYAYAIDDPGRIVGVLRLRDLLLARNRQTVEDIMIASPLTVQVDEPLRNLREFFDRHHFFGAPVVNADGKMLGVALARNVEEADSDRADDDYRKSQGILGEELRTMPLYTRSSRRLAWLSVNILLNVIAASVIAFFQETLESVIALAVFLPIISDMSGCSGSQAVAVSMRELTLNMVKPSEFIRVLLKELSVGLINGIALGVLIAGVAWLWKGNPWLGLVVGAAMGLNTIVAVCLGGLIPLVLKRLKLDPALASGPILTTVTDMCGFFLVLSIASALIDKLV